MKTQTAELAATLLVVGASFFIADGIQTIAQGALRGLNDTATPLLYSLICFWVIAFPAMLRAGLHFGTRRGRHLGRAVGRTHHLRGDADPSLSPPDATRISARRAEGGLTLRSGEEAGHESMMPKKRAPDLIRGVTRFSDNIMLRA